MTNFQILQWKLRQALIIRVVVGMEEVILLTIEGVLLRVSVAILAAVLGVLVNYAEDAAQLQKRLSTTRKINNSIPIWELITL